MDNEIHYAGEICKLIFVYDEREQPDWQNLAQSTINEERKKGNTACCIHEGFEHGLYLHIKE